jgi:hypothetical protein
MASFLASVASCGCPAQLKACVPNSNTGWLYTAHLVAVTSACLRTGWCITLLPDLRSLGICTLIAQAADALACLPLLWH